MYLDVILCPLSIVAALVVDSIKNNCSSGISRIFFYNHQIALRNYALVLHRTIFLSTYFQLLLEVQLWWFGLCKVCTISSKF